MTDLRDRFRSFDRLDAPDLWSEVTQRASSTSTQSEWRFPAMNRFMPFALAAAAAVLVLVGVSVGAVIRPPNIAAPGVDSPSPEATPVLIEPVADVDQSRPLEAGTYVVDDPFPLRISFVVPDGWEAWAYTGAASQINLLRPGIGEVSFEIVANVSADPCTKVLLDPPVGPSVQDLVVALADFDEHGFSVRPPTDIEIDGFSGQRIVLTAPRSRACDSPSTWITTTRQNGVGPGEVNEVNVLDVDGVRLVISVAHRPALSDALQAEVDAVVASVRIHS